MVDNRGVTPVSSFNFKSGDISGTAAKTSEEKNGQGGEYFAQEMQEEETEQETKSYQDRSAQLRASLDSLALANAGSMMIMKTLKKRQDEKNKKLKINKDASDDIRQEEIDEMIFDE